MSNPNKWEVLKEWLQQELILECVIASRKDRGDISEGIARGLNKVLLKIEEIENT